MKLCAYCNINPVKLKKNKCCSQSCAASLRWDKVDVAGRIEKIRLGTLAAKKNKYAIRLKKEIEDACKELNLIPTLEIKKLYIRARNKGYHNGNATGYKRGLNNAKQRIY